MRATLERVSDLIEPTEFYDVYRPLLGGWSADKLASGLRLPGVGPKIANCVLLFAGGFQSAFPVDVWIMKALRELYFPRRRVGEKRIHQFAATHFGPHAGYAQQYLFHYMRTKKCPPPECRLQSAATTQITLLPTEVGVLKGAQVQFRGRCQDLPGGRRGLS